MNVWNSLQIHCAIASLSLPLFFLCRFGAGAELIRYRLLGFVLSAVYFFSVHISRSLFSPNSNFICMHPKYANISLCDGFEFFEFMHVKIFLRLHRLPNECARKKRERMFGNNQTSDVVKNAKYEKKANGK